MRRSVESRITNEAAAEDMVLLHLENYVEMPGYEQKEPPERQANSIRFVFTRMATVTGYHTDVDPVFVGDRQFAEMHWHDFYMRESDTVHLSYTVSWLWYNDDDGMVSLVPLPGYGLVLDLCLCA